MTPHALLAHLQMPQMPIVPEFERGILLHNDRSPQGETLNEN
jgi:hypothetical protein